MAVILSIFLTALLSTCRSEDTWKFVVLPSTFPRNSKRPMREWCTSYSELLAFLSVTRHHQTWNFGRKGYSIVFHTGISKYRNLTYPVKSSNGINKNIINFCDELLQEDFARNIYQSIIWSGSFLCYEVSFVWKWILFENDKNMDCSE
jgi:hypothetical protein